MIDFDMPSLMLAQDGAPPVSTQGGASPGATPGTAAPGGNGATSGGGSSSTAPPGIGSMLLPMIIIVIVFILLSTLTQRRQGKKREAILSSIKKHDKVQTIGGVIGSVVEVKSNTIVLKVDEASNTRMTFARSAIQQVLTEGADEDAAADERR